MAIHFADSYPGNLIISPINPQTYKTICRSFPTDASHQNRRKRNQVGVERPGRGIPTMKQATFGDERAACTKKNDRQDE